MGDGGRRIRRQGNLAKELTPMHLTRFSYARASARWSVDPLPALDSPATLVIAFGAAELRDDDRPFADLRRAFPRSVVIGCSTAGEIDGARVVDDSITAAAIRFEHTRVVLAKARLPTVQASFQAGTELADQLRRGGDDLRAVLVLSEGLHVNGSALVRGLVTRLPTSVVVAGGLAGDGDRFQQTWVLSGSHPASRMACAVGLYGEHVQVGHGSKGGWDPFGPERVITESRGTVLYALDGRPALALYKEYLGERAAGLPGTALLFPLSLRADADAADSVVRTVLSVDEAAQSLTFAGDMPIGAYAKLMRANFDRLILGASDAAAQAGFPRRPGTPGLCIAISCVGRRLVLGTRAEEETEATLEGMPEGTEQIGFYSYGEISPRGPGRCDLHNQTMTLTVISEA